jgi:hypothetical protein
MKNETINIIKRALRDDLSVDEAGRFLSGLRKDADLDVLRAAHAVVHFVTDSDLRLKDNEYDVMLKEQLEEWVRRLS